MCLRARSRSDSIFRRRDPLENVNLLDLRPTRLAKWEDAGERVVLLRPIPRTRGFRGVVERLLSQAAVGRIRLDEVGTVAWYALDGSQTVAEIAGALRLQFGETVEPAEERVGKLIQMLHDEGFVAYPGHDELR